MFAKLKSWLFPSSPQPLLYMRLGPKGKDANPLMLQFFTWDCLHESMSWWKHFEAEIPRLSELGFTQVWLPPPNRPAEVEGRGYDAYDLWDLGEFEHKGQVKTRWGTREELLQACKVAEEHGIDILIDAVLNHKLGADSTEIVRARPSRPDNRLKDAGPEREIEAWTVFSYPGRAGKYSKFKWDQSCFSGVDWDHKTKEKGIFRLTGPGHKGWSRNVDTELGNYDFLLGVDIDHRHPGVQEDLLNWGPWILETTGATGFRLDAIKHIDRKFLLHWVLLILFSCIFNRIYKFLRSKKRVEGLESLICLPSVGLHLASFKRFKLMFSAEYWSGNLKLILPYMKTFKGETAFFDVPLHMNFHHASRERTRYDLRKILDNTIVQAKPNVAVTFVDNHEWGATLKFKRMQSYYSEVMATLVIILFLDLHLITFFITYAQENAGSTYLSHMTGHGRVQIDNQGWGTFSCFANNVQVWVKSVDVAA
ncbi:GH-13 [Panaeolus cyanescens]|uniref:GH-13 n=1 Tax=Panaeolus cyanescens TaxID=181874 RepID=A0A409Y728_9AGAR|nr:GH-13 [Panaeolus cyanescens]